MRSDRGARRAWRVANVALIATAICALNIALSSTAFAKETKGASLLKSTLTAMSNQRSLHWVMTTNATDAATHKPETIVITSDAGKSSGSQSILFKEGSESGTERCELVNHTAYFYGDTFVLERFNGMTAAEARHFEDLWVGVPSSNSAFAGLAEGLTVSTMELLVAIPAPTLVGLEPMVLGHKTNLLEASAATNGVQESVELYVQTRGTPLPVEEILLSAGGRTTTTFSSWGERIRVSAPRNSIPLSV